MFELLFKTILGIVLVFLIYKVYLYALSGSYVHHNLKSKLRKLW